MANDNQASYAKIGFFIVAGISLIAGTLVYLGGAKAKDGEFRAETFFSESVSGLDVGSAVNLRGVRVGRVARISFIGAEYEDVGREDRRKIYVELALDARQFRVMGDQRRPEQVLRDLVMPREDRPGLHAMLSSSGITGLSHIELNFPKGPVREESHNWHEDKVLIPPEPSILQSAADSARNILNQIDQINIVAAWSNVLSVTQNASTALENLNATLSSEQGGISEIVGNVREASASLRDIMDEVKNNPSSLLWSRTPGRLEETR